MGLASILAGPIGTRVRPISTLTCAGLFGFPREADGLTVFALLVHQFFRTGLLAHLHLLVLGTDLRTPPLGFLLEASELAFGFAGLLAHWTLFVAQICESPLRFAAASLALRETFGRLRGGFPTPFVAVLVATSLDGRMALATLALGTARGAHFRWGGGASSSSPCTNRFVFALLGVRLTFANLLASLPPLCTAFLEAALLF